MKPFTTIAIMVFSLIAKLLTRKMHLDKKRQAYMHQNLLNAEFTSVMVYKQ